LKIENKIRIHVILYCARGPSKYNKKIKKPGVVVHTCNASIQETEEKRSCAQVQPRLEFQSQKTKNRKKKEEKEKDALYFYGVNKKTLLKVLNDMKIN
jgi:hypothetical protein